MCNMNPGQYARSMVRNKSFVLRKLTVWKLGLLLSEDEEAVLLGK